jgi:spermidine/putrescine transport system permease protein
VIGVANDQRYKKLRAAMLPLVMTAPACAFVVLFVVIPIFCLGIYSFWTLLPDGTVLHELTWDNWRGLFTGSFYGSVLLDTFRLALVSTVTCALIGYGPAYFMATVDPKWKGPLTLLLFLPSWISYLIRTMSWLPVLGKNGLVNTALMDAGAISEPLPLLYNHFTVYLGLVHYLLPIMILNIYLGLSGVDQTLISAARTLGASSREAFFSVTFPLALQGLSAGCLLCFILTLGTFVTPEILGGPGTLYYGNLVYETILHQLDWPTGSVLAIVIVVLLILLLYIYSRFMGLSSVLRAIKS